MKDVAVYQVPVNFQRLGDRCRKIARPAPYVTRFIQSQSRIFKALSPGGRAFGFTKRNLPLKSGE
ncbi:MAG: hypothetical protein KKF30_15640 [Proteobacteria bacterium]|nr:hypothetical protein [Pseudomonadota bacterium]MBU4472144.1 hypothetical protein [Pseudomonadota bacterium]MCG2752858.1 hypothetical protein [Desulfobacteraceae bacterium]